MSRRFSEGCLFIGRLSKNCRVRDLEDVFEPYGRMSRCEIKYGAEMAYGFVDYEDRRDAEVLQMLSGSCDDEERILVTNNLSNNSVSDQD